MRRAIALSVCVGLACGSAATQDDAPPLERVVVETRTDGGFITLLRGSGAGFDGPRDVAAAPDGSLVVVGGTESPDFPTTPGAHQERFATGGTRLGSFPEMDVFVTKLRSDGTILWSTFLGGPNYDRAYAVEIDAAGAIYVAGRAGAGFPTTPGALQREFAGDREPNRAYGPQDGFVAKLDADGRLLWSTYLGNDSMSFVRDIDVDAEGRVHAALPGRGAFPWVAADAWQPEPGGDGDDVVAKLDADGTRVLWATHLGGSALEGNPSLRVAPDGRVFVMTSSSSDDVLPPGQGFQPERAGGADLLLVRLSPEGAFEAGTYLGGSGNEDTETHHLALDPEGRPVLAARSASDGLPIPAPDRAHRARHSPDEHDCYVAKLSADLDAVVAATYVGAERGGGCEGIAVDAAGQVSLGGATRGGLAPTPGALQSEFGGDRDAYVMRLSPDLSQALYVSYWGGPGHQGARCLAVDREGAIVVAGQATGDVFVARFVVP